MSFVWEVYKGSIVPQHCSVPWLSFSCGRLVPHVVSISMSERFNRSDGGGISRSKKYDLRHTMGEVKVSSGKIAHDVGRRRA